MDSSLDSVLSGQASPEPVAQPEQVEQTQPEPQQAEESTGVEAGTPPEQPKQDDPLERHRKGFEAAAVAERKKRQEAEQRAQALEEQLKALRQPPQAQQTQQVPTQVPPKPLKSQFASEDEWLDARDQWRDTVRALEWQQQEQQREQAARIEKTQSIFAEAMKLEGFDIQAFARLPVPDAMADAILDSDAAPQLVHYLTANPAEAYRIAGLTHTRQVKELARIEDRLTAQPAREEPEQPAKPRLPETLTQTRNAKGQFEKTGYDGPTPLTSILR